MQAELVWQPVQQGKIDKQGEACRQAGWCRHVVQHRKRRCSPAGRHGQALRAKQSEAGTGGETGM